MNDLTKVLFDIATPGLAETIFAPFPRPLDPALCPVCCDATVEKGETCEECRDAVAFDPSSANAFDFWTREQVLEEIARLQQIQKTNRPMSAAWGEASSKLAPLFAEMVRRS